MDNASILYLALGLIFVLVGVSSSFVERAPVTTSIIYLFLGLLLGQHGLHLVDFDLTRDAHLFERVTELVVIVSLFCAGLKLRVPFKNIKWAAPLRLAFASMALTVGGIALFAVYVLHMPWGAGILLGGILAPTDPVLASDVQVKSVTDQDHLRFSLTAEAGLNDGAAFPFVMLGMGMLGLREMSPDGWDWFLHDWLYASAAGVLIGLLLGYGLSWAVIELRARHKNTEILDDFLALGLIAVAYGAALMASAYGFLAVFAAGLAMRRIETDKPKVRQDKADSPAAVLTFTEQMERLGEVFTVVFIGTMVNLNHILSADLWLIPALLFVIRPVAVMLGLIGAPIDKTQRPWICWFGIRGIGSLFYLTYAAGRGLPEDLADRLSSITLATVIVSIVLHGISSFPFMKFYESRGRK